MAVKSTDSYMNYPPYIQAMRDFQTGKWQAGLDGLAEVEKKFPLDTELRSLRQEMQVRARIDGYEIEENRVDKRLRFRRFAIRALLLVLVVLLTFFVITTYSGWLQSQWNTAQESISSEIKQNELEIKLLNALQLLKVGHTVDAQKILDEINQADPAYPGLSEALNAAASQQKLETDYARAMELLANGEAQESLEILQQINEQAPQYRDVSIQIQTLKSQTNMDASLEQAEQAADEERWDDAIAGYEALRLLDPLYKTEQVEGQLFQAYIQSASNVLDDPNPTLELLQVADYYFSQALSLRPQDREVVAARTAVRNTIEERMVANYILEAQTALVESADSLQALATAGTWFSRALEIRPNDPNILMQYQLAELFLTAQKNYTGRDYDAVIKDLEYVVGLEENYANGTALQTLYEGYIGRGKVHLSTGDYLLAITDFQKAVSLSEKMAVQSVTYLEAQILIAETEGLSGNFQGAILLYQTALNDSGLRERFLGSNTSLAKDIVNADYTAAEGNPVRAFQLYRALLGNRILVYDNRTTVMVQPGDYLTSLARQHGTSVTAILLVNQMTSQDTIQPNNVLIIPTLP